MNIITIIEDEETIRENLEALLSIEGYKVNSFEDGRSALTFLKNNSTDLILCDIMLPDLDGYDILKIIKNEKSKKHIPFILLTAKNEMSDLRAGMNLGADDYLTKPYNTTELLNVIKKRIELSIREDEETDISSIQKLELNDKLFVKSNKNVTAVVIKNIVCINAQAEYSEIHLENKSKVVVRKLIKDWENSLPQKSFVRIHKSIIINLDYLIKVEKWFNNSYKILLSNFDEPIFSSRRYSSKLRSKFII